MTQEILNKAIALDKELQALISHRDAIVNKISRSMGEDEDEQPPRKKSMYPAPARATFPPVHTGTFDTLSYNGINLKLSILFDTSDFIALYLSRVELEIQRLTNQIEAL